MKCKKNRIGLRRLRAGKGFLGMGVIEAPLHRGVWGSAVSSLGGAGRSLGEICILVALRAQKRVFWREINALSLTGHLFPAKRQDVSLGFLGYRPQ